MTGRSPHPSRGRQPDKIKKYRHVIHCDAARTPHGDGNQDFITEKDIRIGETQPAPLTGTATLTYMLHISDIDR